MSLIARGGVARAYHRAQSSTITSQTAQLQQQQHTREKHIPKITSRVVTYTVDGLYIHIIFMYYQSKAAVAMNGVATRDGVGMPLAIYTS